MLSIGDSLFPEKFPYKSEWFAGIRDQESFLQRSAVLPPQACVLPLYVASSAAYNYFWTFRDFPALLCGYTLHKFPQCRKPSSFHESDLRKYAGSYPQIFLCVQYTFLLYLRQLPVCAFCGAQRTSMRFRADAVQSITDALKRLLLSVSFWAGSLQCSVSLPVSVSHWFQYRIGWYFVIEDHRSPAVEKA